MTLLDFTFTQRYVHCLFQSISQSLSVSRQIVVDRFTHLHLILAYRDPLNARIGLYDRGKLKNASDIGVAGRGEVGVCPARPK